MSQKRPEDLSVEELRRLLLDKRRTTRRERLEQFRRTGRTMQVSPSVPAEDGAYAGRVVESAPAALVVPVSNSRRWFNRLLTLVEVLAIVGLFGIILNGLSLIRTLNEEVNAAIQLPTFTATPLITAVVLPSGHTPPNSPQGAQPNEAEIPDHLRPLVQSLANVALPTPGPEQAIRIQIPALGVDAPVVQGDGWEQLKKGVGQHIGTANPGQVGNVVLAAHNDIFGEIFRDLDRLQPGDDIILYTNVRQYVYRVTGTLIVEPTRVEVMSPTPQPTVTLISCYPYMVSTERIVVFADLQTP
jgi:sortase A